MTCLCGARLCSNTGWCRTKILFFIKKFSSRPLMPGRMFLCSNAPNSNERTVMRLDDELINKIRCVGVTLTSITCRAFTPWDQDCQTLDWRHIMRGNLCHLIRLNHYSLGCSADRPSYFCHLWSNCHNSWHLGTFNQDVPLVEKVMSLRPRWCRVRIGLCELETWLHCFVIISI